MSSFSITRKKTPFQKHREEEEARKKKKEEYETARPYQEFVESFQGDNATKGLFVWLPTGSVNILRSRYDMRQRQRQRQRLRNEQQLSSLTLPPPLTLQLPLTPKPAATKRTGLKSFVRGGTINPSDKHKVDSEVCVRSPLFNFLFEPVSIEHTYYVWRLYSFAFDCLITKWIPPPLPVTKSLEHDKESTDTYAAGRSRREEVERTLTDPQRDEFEDMLRALTLERSQIKEAIGFALDNADAAEEVVEVLTESLTLKETSIPTKVARLLLVSDILHNSSVPVKNASAYRTKFEAAVPDIMESFNDLYRSITGRITAEALKERVLKVLQVWADWFLFSDAYIYGLRATFLRSGTSGVTSFHSLCGDEPEIEKKGYIDNLSDIINPDTALAIGKGAARNNYAEVQMKEPMTISISQPELKAFVEKEKNDLILTASKWAREDDETDDVQKKSYSPGSDNTGGVTFKVQIKRKKLEVDYGLSGSNEGNRNLLLTAEKSIVERKEKPEDSRERSKKRHRGETNNSQSPPRKSSTRERDHDLDRDRDRGRLRDRDRQHDLNRERDRLEKSSSHDRDDHGRSRERDRDWRRRDLR
ncbi:LOW QUALITY PROTEIN: hypothetical protein BRARA_F02709 [Brassica rapa]|uniref:CID domain-containing protein n=1 Tax=Brassica campestris TaxID=3711 RepID=A0A397Z5M3_BRACM|nr:LOW QUALITY PROTEIN: hypothetical protein BRARA_F02709 [Brassica rapa]